MVRAQRVGDGVSRLEGLHSTVHCPFLHRIRGGLLPARTLRPKRAPQAAHRHTPQFLAGPAPPLCLELHSLSLWTLVNPG